MQYRPEELLCEEFPAGQAKPSLVILNQPIADFEVFRRLWRHAGYRLCADGGANRLCDMFAGSQKMMRDEYVSKSTRRSVNAPPDNSQLPDIIHGDLDSLRQDVRDFYASKGVTISQDPDQYSTDFGKAMHKVLAQESSSGRKDVIILGTLAGRVDQGLALLHEIIREQNKHQDVRLWLVSESNISFLLQPGQNAIYTRLSSGYFTKNVGIIPVNGPAVITTSGLEWDVRDWKTQMGHQVSTSNHIVEDVVKVASDEIVLFTVERTTKLPA